MRTSTLSWILLLASSASAIVEVGIDAYGPPSADNVARNAALRPNSTRTTEFQKFSNGDPEAWSWQVNVSEIPVPNDGYTNSANTNYSMNYRKTLTHWLVKWPTPTYLYQYLQERALDLEVKFYTGPIPNARLPFYNASANGSCAGVLGDQCASSLLKSIVAPGNFALSRVDGCQEVFLQANRFSGTGSTFSAPPSNSTNTTIGPRNTEPFFFRASDTYVAGNNTELNIQEGALQLLILNFIPSQSGRSYRSGDAGPLALCQIVDRDAVRDINSSVPAPAPGTGGVAGGWSVPVMSVGVLAGLVTVFMQL